ncbi:hypothetical protein RND81_08G092100 [Saponaria officinalis]|uniref:FBD domain-containing protein n=1 Tax=Saponaria officinalis TaxID=3572 RepID=A0AAW1J677_SAPOF
MSFTQIFCRWREIFGDGERIKLQLTKMQSKYKKSMHNSEEISTCVMPLLKTVTIHCLKNCFVDQLKLSKLLLGNAIVLEKLVISFEKKQMTAVEENDLVEQVSRFRKASINATVVFA